MFGIGFSEMIVIAIVLIIAVGPNKLPTMLKAVGKAMREFRRATRELRAQSGIDDLMNDEDIRGLRDLRKPLSASPQRKHVGAPPSREPLDAEAKRKEYPPEGVDFAVSAEAPPPTPPPATPAGANGSGPGGSGTDALPVVAGPTLASETKD